MDKYNIIPIGDHCAISVILKSLDLREHSYPFDWVVKVEQLHDTNILYNVNLIHDLRADNIVSTVDKYIGDALNNHNKVNTQNSIWFAHEIDNESNVKLKYIRRFQRLYDNLRAHKNIFILLTRVYLIEESDFNKIVEILLHYNNNNIILFVSGINHQYLYNEKYKKNIIFKHIVYDVDKAFAYDSIFRSELTDYLKYTISSIIL